MANESNGFDYSKILGKKPYRPYTTYFPFELQEQVYGRGGTLPSGAIKTGPSYDPLSEGIDTEWAGKTSDGQKFNSYYDYYFSGEDIKVYIDGLFDPEYELDIASFGFVIAQQKQPVYGFWSYNYDAMMLGTRIITGEFSVYSRYPGRMRDLLSKAAEQRVLFASGNKTAMIQSFLTGNDPQSEEDEKNIKKYWNRSSLDRITSDSNNSDSRNIFSAHPPFNFIIKYGTQDGSVSTKTRNQGTSSEDNFDTLDRIMATDFNERLIKSGKTNSDMDIVLQDVNLINMATNILPGGQAIIENYQFMSRDMYISSGNMREPRNITVSSVDSSGVSSTESTTTQKSTDVG